MSKLFISYRHDDSADVTGRMHERLLSHFGDGNVFLDIDTIPIGMDFRRCIGDAVNQCDVLLAVIGDRWLDARVAGGPRQGGRRLDDPNDYVRIEIESALARGIPVVPLLVGKATMPGEAHLPDGLKELAFRHAAEVRPGLDFPAHLDRLINRLEKLLALRRKLTAGAEKASHIASEDPPAGLWRAGKLLEHVVREVYERRFQEPAGTRPLESLIQRLDREAGLRGRFDGALSRALRAHGTADGGETVASAEVEEALGQLTGILNWYIDVEEPSAFGQASAEREEAKPDLAKPAAQPPAGPESPIAIVPKGLRSFDADDSDFFLQLLPGPRDKNGLPESIRFWKHRIESADDPSFTVGVIYGPSGCGKSSLVKAGLLPRLARRVIPVYLEATPNETETRILAGLRKKLPGLDDRLDLIQTIAALRRRRGLKPGQKVLLVVDQFEQWLHARRQEQETDLAKALRQCDVEHIQCVVTVRDDFWVSLSRFMGDLRIEILQGQNAALVDLFDLIHARNVLVAFGRAFGRLPGGDGKLTKDQETFVAEAIAGLAQDGRVISIRLALFAEMVKGKTWTASTLKQVGGAQGVGVNFLEETFASAALRAHQKAGQAVLKALLPESGSNIKGNMRSYQELAQASGYANRPDQLEALLRLLDRDLRLITPTEAEGGESTSKSTAPDEPGPPPSPQRGEGARRAAERATPVVGTPPSVPSPQRGEGARMQSPLICPSDIFSPRGEGAGEGATPSVELPPAITSPRHPSGEIRLGRTHDVGGEGEGEAARTESPLICPSDIFSPRGEGAGERATPTDHSPLTTHRSPPASDHSPLTTRHSPPRYYQLTHDYLVPALREWLTRKQMETRRGRAELRLAERAALWNAKPESRHLPSLWEWLNVSTLTDRAHWTEPQRKMMRRSARTHGWRSALALVGMIAVGAAGIVLRNQVAQQKEATRIEGLVGSLVRAEPSQVPDIVKQLDANPEIAAPLLIRLISGKAETPDEKRAQLHGRLAMVSRDPSQVEPLVEELLAGKVAYVLPIRQSLGPAGARLTERFRGLLRDDKAGPDRRFRAALALAGYVPASLEQSGNDFPESRPSLREGTFLRGAKGDNEGTFPPRRTDNDPRPAPESVSWTEADLRFVAGQLVSANAEIQPLLREALRPIGARLLGDLERLFAQATDTQRMGAANALADYAEKDIARLARLLAVATKEQFAVIYPIVAAGRTPATIEDLGKIAATPPPDALGSVERVAYGQRRAGAAVTLLLLGERDNVLPVFEVSDDPEAMTQFIFRCRERGIGVEALLDCLERVRDNRPNRHPRDARYALLLALGEFRPADVSESRRDALIKQLAGWYRDDPSSGVHGAAGWLLRQWGQVEVVRQVDQTPIPYSPDREWFTLRVTVKPTPPLKPREGGRAEDASAKYTAAKRDTSTQSKAGPTAKQAASGDAANAIPTAQPAPPPKAFYYTFIVFPPGEFTTGSVTDEPGRQKEEARHRVRLTRPFALLDREIAFEELIAFHPMYAGYMRQLDAKPEDAGFGADWYDAVGFCRWLGQQMGLPESDQCYADPAGLDNESYPREPNPEANWAPRNWPLELARRGFRLPTEAEWEVASRAGARTAYGYGGDASLLDRFGWFTENSGKHVHPPRELRPDRRGLLDLNGNLFEWTHDWYRDFDTKASTDPRGPDRGSLRVNRGGGWVYDAAGCRSARRDAYVPSFRSPNYGFRPALSPSGGPPQAPKER
jgi:formylglycine-generating enzyme required for sulfatase activity